LKAKRTVIVVSTIEVIAIIVIIVYITAVVPDDYHVPWSQEPSLELPPLSADRRNFDVHGAINTDQVWILLYQCACL
jgi:hypothetical protein